MKRQEPPAASAGSTRGGIQPWHLLVLGVLAAGAATVYVTSGSGATKMVFAAIAVAAAGLVTAGAYRTLVPLFSTDAGEQTEMLGGRTRAALEREKMLVLRSIKEVEFDRAMRKISDADFLEMVTRLRSRAAGLIRQLDGAVGYRELIERDLARLSGTSPRSSAEGPGSEAGATPIPAPGTCGGCGIINDADARFCKACGAALAVRS